MDESKKEVLLSDIPEDIDPYKDYKTIAEKKTDKWLIKVTTDGLNIDKEEANRLIDNTYRGAIIATDINKGSIRGYEEELAIRFSKRGMAGLMNDLNANELLLSEDDDSQRAAVIHEMIHGIEENIDLPEYFENTHPETITLAAEFMFAGDSRDPYFQYLTDEVIDSVRNNKGLSYHSSGWQRSLKLLQEPINAKIDLSKEGSDSILRKIKQVRDLEETRKIELIQDLIEQNKRSS